MYDSSSPQYWIFLHFQLNTTLHCSSPAGPSSTYCKILYFRLSIIFVVVFITSGPVFVFNGIAHPYLLNTSIIIRMYLKPLLLFEKLCMSTKSAVHIASVPEANTLQANTLLFLNFFRIGLCSSSASSLLQLIPQPSFLFYRLSFVRVSYLSFRGCLWVPPHPVPVTFHHHTRVFPPSFRCLDSRYRVALISRRQRCTVPVQLAVDHGHLIARAVGYMALYTCDMVLQNPSLVVGVYQSPCVYLSLS